MSAKTKIRKIDIKLDTARSYEINDIKIVVCNVNGKFYAVDDVCSHDEGELVSGEGVLVENCQLECPRHGARFDVTSGKAVKMPAIAPIKTYKVSEIGNDLEIEVD